MSLVKTLRADEKDWDRWRTCAALSGLSLNAWCLRALNHVAQVEEALARLERNESGSSVHDGLPGSLLDG